MISAAPMSAPADPRPEDSVPEPAPPAWFDPRFAEASERLALFLRLRHGVTAEEELDLVHEVYLRARRTAADFQEQRPGGFLAWLCTIGRSVRIDEARRRAARPEFQEARSTFTGMLSAAADPRTGPLTAAGRIELRARVAEAVEALPEPGRTLLLDRFFGGLSQATLAEAHGMSESSVQRALARALATVGRPLRELAGDKGAEGGR